MPAEHEVGQNYTTAFDWSTQLTQAVQGSHFWKLKLKLHKDQHVSSQLLKQYHAVSGLPEETLTNKHNFGELVQSIREAYQKMRTAKSDHHKNRMS